MTLRKTGGVLYPGPVPMGNASYMSFPGGGGSRTLVKTWLWRTAGSDSKSLYKVYGVYWELVMKLQGGREPRRSVIYSRGGSVVLAARRLVKNWRFSVWRECRGHGVCGKVGANYRPEFSYSWTSCRAWSSFSMTSSHEVHFDTGTVRVTLVSITCRWIGMWATMSIRTIQ